jgi:hypothetical protein
VAAFSRIFVIQAFFLNLHKRLKKFLLRRTSVCKRGLNSPTRAWYEWWAFLALVTLVVASLNSLSHHGLALDDGRLSSAERARAFFRASESVSAYSSNCSVVGYLQLCSAVSFASDFCSSWEKNLAHSAGSILFVQYLIPSVFSISLRPWSTLNLMAL